jgi:transposase
LFDGTTAEQTNIRNWAAAACLVMVGSGRFSFPPAGELCRKEGIVQSLYYTWSKEFMEAGKRRLAGDTARAATSGEVQDLRREARALKECVADLTLENRLFKKARSRMGATTNEVGVRAQSPRTLRNLYGGAQIPRGTLTPGRRT